MEEFGNLKNWQLEFGDGLENWGMRKFGIGEIENWNMELGIRNWKLRF